MVHARTSDTHISLLNSCINWLNIHVPLVTLDNLQTHTIHLLWLDTLHA